MHGGWHRGWWFGDCWWWTAFHTLTSDTQNLCQYTEDSQMDSKYTFTEKAMQRFIDRKFLLFYLRQVEAFFKKRISCNQLFFWLQLENILKQSQSLYF